MRQVITQTKIDRYILFKKLFINYVELENRLKGLEENLTHNKQKI